jgi:hypothetical protein
MCLHVHIFCNLLILLKAPGRWCGWLCKSASIWRQAPVRARPEGLRERLVKGESEEEKTDREMTPPPFGGTSSGPVRPVRQRLWLSRSIRWRTLTGVRGTSRG